MSAHHGDVEILRYLIKHGANVHLTDRMHLSALDHACLRLNIEPIRELISSGCKCSSSTPYGLNSPLKTLIINKEFALARILIESGINLSNEKWIISNFKSETNSENINTQFFNWLNNYMKTPPTLLNISRIKIRNLLNRNNLEANVYSLKIPKFLKDFLMMKH